MEASPDSNEYDLSPHYKQTENPKPPQIEKEKKKQKSMRIDELDRSQSQNEIILFVVLNKILSFF